MIDAFSFIYYILKRLKTVNVITEAENITYKLRYKYSNSKTLIINGVSRDITYEGPKLSKAYLSDNIIDLQENINNVKSNSVQYLSGTKNINANILYAKDVRIEERKKIAGTYRTEQQDIWSSRYYYISSDLPIIPGTFYAQFSLDYNSPSS